MTIKFGVLNDIHLADKNPLGRVGNYQDQLFEKLSGVAAIMADKGADLLVCTGDIFHLKQPNFVSHALVNRIMDMFRYDFEMPVLIVPGNHDLSEAGLDSLPRQPLGSLFASDVAIPLMSEQEYLVSNGKVRAMFVGRPFATESDLNPYYYLGTDDERSMAARDKANVIIMVAHGSLIPTAKVAPPYENIAADSIPWDDGAYVPDILFAGHLHEDYGLHKIKGGPIYVNFGSFGRPSRNQKDVDKRDFAFTTITDEMHITIERIPIPHMLPAAEVFLEKAEQHEDEALAEFAEQLASSLTLEDGNVEDALAALGEIPANVKARLRKYLEEAGI